jgi:hypothetical protein
MRYVKIGDLALLVHVLGGLVILVMGGRVVAQQVDDAKSAIVRANDACSRAWADEERQLGYNWSVAIKDWHARAIGDRWYAWTGDEKQPDYKIDFARNDLHPDGHNCAVRIIDDPVPYLYPPPPSSGGGWSKFPKSGVQPSQSGSGAGGPG